MLQKAFFYYIYTVTDKAADKAADKRAATPTQDAGGSSTDAAAATLASS